MSNPINVQGIRKVPTALTSIVAANTSTTAYQISTDRTSSARITKIFVANRAGAVIQLLIGETVAAAFVQRIPSIMVPNATDAELTEEEIPAFIFTSDIVVRSNAAAAAPADVQVLLEVEEYR